MPYAGRAAGIDARVREPPAIRPGLPPRAATR
jgi:hypothetical protein